MSKSPVAAPKTTGAKVALQETLEMASDTESVREGTNIPIEQRGYNIPEEVLARLGSAEVESLITWLDGYVQQHLRKPEAKEAATQKAEISRLLGGLDAAKYSLQLKNIVEHERDEISSSYCRLAAEKAELELENKTLRQQAREHMTYMNEVQDKRRLVLESHASELRATRELIKQLRNDKVRLGLQSRKYQMLLSRKEVELKEYLNQEDMFSKQLSELSERVEVQKKVLIEQADALKRYAPFDSIINQLRTMSIQSPSDSQTTAADIAGGTTS